MRTYRVELEGLTPLIMHWDNIEWADQMDEWRADPKNKKLSKAGDDRTPAWRWIGCVYHNGKEVCIPQDNVARCLMEGGAMVPVPGGRGNKTFKSQTQSGMKIDDFMTPLIVNGGSLVDWTEIESLMKESSFRAHTESVKKRGFRLFVKRARVGQSKHIRVRPLFEKWRLSLQVSVWDEQLTKDVLESIFSFSGQYKGLCEWRPGGRTPGPYGMFQVSGIEQA